MPKLNHNRNTRSKNAEKFGKGKVTPVQVAFIVDRYLLDNKFSQTRAAFRSEASNLIAKSPVHEAPKSLLSLGAMLDEYISLKEQKVNMEQERHRMEQERRLTEQEKFRVDTLLKGLQTAMSAFNATAPLVTPPPQLPPPPTQPPFSVNSAAPSSCNTEQLPAGSTPGYYSAHPSPAVIKPFEPSKSSRDITGASKLANNHTASKRKPSADANLATKRTRRSSTMTNQPMLRGSTPLSVPSAANNVAMGQGHSAFQPQFHTNGSMMNGSNPVQNSQVVKCLFNSYSDPKTPPLPSSFEAEKTASPLEKCEAGTSSKETTTPPQQITSTNCTIISSETIRVSPEKQISYYSIERNQCISTSSSPDKTNSKVNRRDHVKGRLDFDAPEVNTEHQFSNDDMLDLDFANFDALENINIHKLLSDFDLTEEGTSCSSPGATASSPESYSWSPENSTRVNMGANQVFSQLSSTVTEFHQGQDPASSGPDPFTTVKSVTKTIKILSPAKNQRNRSQQGKLHVEDLD